MRKQFVHNADQQSSRLDDETWLDLHQLADVELTSESADHPIESALLPSGNDGWRADQPGEQTIRLLFTKPQTIRRIWLEVVESSAERTQQFVLRWSADGGKSFREIVRQQWNFSPTGSTHEMEDYHVDLPDATVVELSITPDTSGGEARASLARLLFA